MSLSVSSGNKGNEFGKQLVSLCHPKEKKKSPILPTLLQLEGMRVPQFICIEHEARIQGRFSTVIPGTELSVSYQGVSFPGSEYQKWDFYHGLGILSNNYYGCLPNWASKVNFI